MIEYFASVWKQQPHPLATVRNKHYIKIDSLVIPIRIEEMNGIQIIHVLRYFFRSQAWMARSASFFSYSERPWKAGLSHLLFFSSGSSDSIAYTYFFFFFALRKKFLFHHKIFLFLFFSLSLPRSNSIKIFSYMTQIYTTTEM